MLIRRLSSSVARLTLAMGTATLLLSVQAHAQDWGTLLVTPDGRVIEDVPELGSVRTTTDVNGRVLVLDRNNVVIGFEMTPGEYRREFGRRPFQDGDRGYASTPTYPSDMPPEAKYPMNPYPDDGGWDNRGDVYGPDDFPTAPQASIERRDLNPDTASVPPRDDIGPRRPNESQGMTAPATAKLSKAEVANLQVFLDRAGMSPGVIDGRMGSNVEKALAAWTEAGGQKIDPSDAEDIMDRLASGDGMAFTTYEITPEDAAGPYVASIPADYSEKAKLERLAYTSTIEMLAERFHMDEDYLKEINPDADFTRPGTRIKVVAPGAKRKGKVASIIADKGRKQVRGYDENGKLLVAYPATIGSSDTPSPTGTVEIKRIAHNPGYTYNPKVNFKQGENDKVLEIPPGPNGPVGNTWIALSKPTYGIHGTPEPSKIGKTASHGCVRLTNWDANELAGMVEPGVTVTFEE
ncbi:MAG: hypothetical protein CML30_16620 [Rhizobiales bacterium]|nr:hypothetical protein [Hyphomicrobiales bacterium]